MNKKKFDISNLKHVSTDKLNRREIKEVEEVIQAKENIIKEMRRNLLETKSEKTTLKERVKKLETERNNLKNKLRKIKDSEPNLKPSNVLKEVSSALTEAQKELTERDLTIGDYEVELKTNLVYTDEGVRMHLPSLTEEFISDNLSKIRFKVGETKKSIKDEYLEIPDLRFLTEKEAKEKIRINQFKIGEISYIEEGEPGIVQKQYPEPFILAPPETEIDLTISKEIRGSEKNNEEKDKEKTIREKELKKEEDIKPKKEKRDTNKKDSKEKTDKAEKKHDLKKQTKKKSKSK